MALADNKPVVALESTIITHGMPYPHNLRYFLHNVHVKETKNCNFATFLFSLMFNFMTMFFSTAKEVEDIVRAEGATPATIGVINGQVLVGLSSQELDQLARHEGSLKVSRRDLPYVISKVRNVAHIHFWLLHFLSTVNYSFIRNILLFYTVPPARHIQPHLSAQNSHYLSSVSVQSGFPASLTSSPNCLTCTVLLDALI